ncbi:MAG: OsmC family protein [Nitrospirae bacterium]|nr:MAG: OsmC family protein [Nitrospirota bacterium]
MECRVKWVEGMCFLAETGSGHAVVMDTSPEFGGRNLGVRPMELLLVGMGGCTSVDVVSILRKGRFQVLGCEVEVRGERAAEPPKVYTRIHVHYRITGRGIPADRIERAIALSKEKLCSASIMLGKAAEITHDYEYREADGA